MPDTGITITGFGACMINGTPFEYEDSLFAKALNRLKLESSDPIRSEIVSLGGFPAPRAVKYFKKKVLAGKPDIVVLQFGSSDAAVQIQKKLDNLTQASRKPQTSKRESTSHINDDRINWRHVLKWELKSIVGLLLRMPPVTSQEKYLEAIRQVIAEAKEANTTLIVLSPFVLGSRFSDFYAKRYTAALRKEIEGQPNTYLLDAHTELSKYPKTKMLCHEGFHISRRAHDIVGKQLADLIASIRARKTESPSLPRDANPLAIFFYRIGPYHNARLRTAAASIPTTVIEYSDVDPVYDWDKVRGSEGFERRWLFLGKPIQQQKTSDICDRVEAALDETKPNLVAIAGWVDRPALAALHWCYKHHIPTIVMTETTPWDNPRAWWKEAIKRQIVKCFTSGFAGGTPHADYLATLGIPKSRIFLGYDAVDNDYFAQAAAKVKARTALNPETGNLKPETKNEHVPAGAGRVDCPQDGPQGATRGSESVNIAAEIRNSQRPIGNEGTTAVSSVDGDRPGIESSPPQSTKNDELGTKCPPSPFFLASARFIEKKNLFNLISAFAAYRDMPNGGTTAVSSDASNGPDSAGPSNWSLVLLGDGPLKARLIAHAKSLSLNVVEHAPWDDKAKAESRNLKAEMEGNGVEPSSFKSQASGLTASNNTQSKIQNPQSGPVASATLFLPGFKQYHELPEYYARAGAFVHASTTEQWGLVVNEAMASGLPVIVSSRCGCASDLVQEGVNGFTFDPANVSQLADLLLKVSAFHFPLSAFSSASAQIISNWGTDRFASGLQQAAAAALAAGPVKPTLLQKLVLNALLAR